jgi:hypothetical protein
MLSRLRGGVRAECVKYMSLFHCHTLPPLPHTRTSPPFTHARIQSVSKYRSKGKLRVREKGREAGEEEMACSARRETCLRSRSTPRFLTLSLALCTPAASCPPKTSRNSAAPQRRHTLSAARATGLRTRQLQSQSGAEEGGGRCSMLEAFASMGGRIV